MTVSTPPLPILDFLGLSLQCLQALVVLIGVPLVIWQISEQTRATRVSIESLRMASYLQLMDRSSEMNRLVVDVKELRDFYDVRLADAGNDDAWSSLDQKERRHYIHLGQLLSVMERAFLLWSRGWIDGIDFAAYGHHLEEISALPQFKRWWPMLRDYYRSDFSSFVDQIAAEPQHSTPESR